MKDAKIILLSLDEIEERLKEEVDYRIERNNTNWFAEHVKLEGINIPRIYDEFSAQHVLTTQYMPGLHLEEWLASNPGKEQRNKAAQKLYDFFVHSARDLQCLHADPNPWQLSVRNRWFHQRARLWLRAAFVRSFHARIPAIAAGLSIWGSPCAGARLQRYRHAI